MLRSALRQVLALRAVGLAFGGSSVSEDEAEELRQHRGLRAAHDEAADVVGAARSAGVSRVYLAGAERALGEAPHRPDEYLTAKINAVEALSNLLTRLGA